MMSILTVVWAAVNWLLDVFWFHVHSHGTDDGSCRWWGAGLEPDWTGCSHTDKELVDGWRVSPGCGFGVLLLSIRYSNVALHTLDHPHHPSAPSLAHSSVGALGYGVAEQLRMKGRAECIPGSTVAKSCSLSPYDPARYSVRAEVSHQTVPPRPNARLRKWIRASRSFDSVTLWAR